MIIAIFDGKKLDLRRFYDVLLPMHMFDAWNVCLWRRFLVLDFLSFAEEILTETIYYKNNINLAKNDFFVCCLIFFDEILRKILWESACDLKISLIFNALFFGNKHQDHHDDDWYEITLDRWGNYFLGFDFNRER